MSEDDDLMTYVLPDVLQPGLDVVFVGTAAGERSARDKAYYANPRNKFWPVLCGTGLTPRQLSPHEYASLPKFGLGLTDLAKTTSGNDKNLHTEDFDVKSFNKKIRLHSPRAIAFNGIKAARIWMDRSRGRIPYGLTKSPDDFPSVFVLPSTSGSANRYWDAKVWQSLADWVTQTR